MKSNSIQKNSIYIFSIILVLVVSYQYFHTRQSKFLKITSFDECVEAGYVVTASYPEVCSVYGKRFINPRQHVNSQSTSTSSQLAVQRKVFILNGEQLSFEDGKGTLPPTNQEKTPTKFEIMDNPARYDINDDGQMDEIVIIRTVPDDPSTKPQFYVSALVSKNATMYCVNALFIDYSLIGAAFGYKNGELQLGYTTSIATTTLKQKNYKLENNMLKQLAN